MEEWYANATHVSYVYNILNIHKPLYIVAFLINLSFLVELLYL